MSTQALPSIDTIEDIFGVLDTEVTALAEYLDPSFFEGFDVFAPGLRGRKREFGPRTVSRPSVLLSQRHLRSMRSLSRSPR